jgi:D-3-phosphoglycerate dehydrogenase
MAAQEIEDYLKNGNIKNSVNLPSVQLERMGVSRICVIHRNIPRMITRILDIIGAQNINVEHMINSPAANTPTRSSTRAVRSATNWPKA